MKIARYFPSFCDDDDFEDYLTEVSTWQELIALPWVKRWSDDPNFIEFKIKGCVLIAVMGGEFMRRGLYADCMIAYAYEGKPFLIQEPGVTNPWLINLPR